MLGAAGGGTALRALATSSARNSRPSEDASSTRGSVSSTLQDVATAAASSGARPSCCNSRSHFACVSRGACAADVRCAPLGSAPPLPSLWPPPPLPPPAPLLPSPLPHPVRVVRQLVVQQRGPTNRPAFASRPPLPRLSPQRRSGPAVSLTRALHVLRGLRLLRHGRPAPPARPPLRRQFWFDSFQPARELVRACDLSPLAPAPFPHGFEPPPFRGALTHASACLNPLLSAWRERRGLERRQTGVCRGLRRCSAERPGH